MFPTLLVALLSSLIASAQTYQISTIAGTGTYGGDGGPALKALMIPGALATDSNGDLYVADPSNYRIRKIGGSGNINSVIGQSYGGFAGDTGMASAAVISAVTSMAVDSSGDLYFADSGNLRVREISGGTVNTVAGNGNCGTVTAGMPALSAPLCDIESVTVDSLGNLYFASESQVWMVNTSGTLVAIAGTGGTGDTGDGHLATKAQIGYPQSLAVDLMGNVYIGDSVNFVVRQVAPNGVIGTAITLTDISESAVYLATDSQGDIFCSDGAWIVHELQASSGQVLTVLNTASGQLGPLPGDPNILSIAVDSTGAIYFASDTQKLYKRSNGANGYVPYAGGYPTSVQQQLPNTATSVNILTGQRAGIPVDANGNVYFPEASGGSPGRIDQLSPSGTLSAVPAPAGFLLNGSEFPFYADSVAISPSGQIFFTYNYSLYSLSNGQATLVAFAPCLNLPNLLFNDRIPMSFDQSGNLYIAYNPVEGNPGLVCKVTPSGNASIFAGGGEGPSPGDGKLATMAFLNAPLDVKADNKGNVYIADLAGGAVRMVNSIGVISTIAGTGVPGSSGDGGPATKAQVEPAAIALDPAGNLFIAEVNSIEVAVNTPNSNRIRMIDTQGNIHTIAGPVPGYNGENIPSTTAALGYPTDLATDAQGNLYVKEIATQRIRKLTLMGGANTPQITSVNTAGGATGVSGNDWIEIHGSNLAASNVGSAGMTWSGASSFAQGMLPTQVANVSVTVNGEPAYVYFVSTAQINVLTPGAVSAPLTIVVNNGAASSQAFIATFGSVTPSFLKFGSTNYVTATHADNSLLGPASLSAPGYTFTPAAPGETIVTYAVGFGEPSGNYVAGAELQSGSLPGALPVVKVGGVNATVSFAGIISPGLAQINFVIPSTASIGDNTVTVTYTGVTSPVAEISVQN